MKRLPLILLLVALATALLVSLVLAQVGEVQPTPTWYVVEAGVTSGGGYRLASRTWHVDGPASGDGYSLEGPIRPFQGAGCCCTYLPCVFDNANP